MGDYLVNGKRVKGEDSRESKQIGSRNVAQGQWCSVGVVVLVQAQLRLAAEMICKT